MTPPRLSVNIDHVATVRQARQAPEPDPVHAAVLAELAGAHGITVHLRQDRRHINERDVQMLRRTIQTRLNVEMAATDEMVRLAVELNPHVCTLVPESPDEVTTTGGLNLTTQASATRAAAAALTAAGIQVSVFIDPDPVQVRAAADSGVRLIELNTGRYADLVPNDLAHAPMAAQTEMTRLGEAARQARALGLTVLAGHGLTYRNVRPVAALPEVEELNIGHNIVARSVLVGMQSAVREMLRCLGWGG